MNPFYDDMKKKKVDSEEEDTSDSSYTDTDEKDTRKQKGSKKGKNHKHNDHSKKQKTSKHSKKQTSSEEDSESSDPSEKTSSRKTKVITDENRTAFISPFVDQDRGIVKKALKILRSYKIGEINEKKVISRMIKLCGVDAAKSIVQGGASLFTEKVLVDKLAKAVEEYNWPSMITSIEDQLKEEKYEDNDDEATKKLIGDYNDIRKNGTKLKKRMITIMKRLEKKSEIYKKLRDQKKSLESLQEECDRCIDESNVDMEELGELILQYSECVNIIVSLLNEPMDIPEESDSDSDSGRQKKVHMPKFDDEDDDDSESAKIRIRNRKAVYKTIIKEPNGKLSMSHITLEPRAQAGIPLPVEKGDVVGFAWKEESGSRMLFRSVLSINGNDDNVMDIIPLQVRIAEYHMILRVPEKGILRLGWDNGLSLRKSKEIDIFVKRFSKEASDAVMAAEEKRQEAWRQVEKSDLTEGNMEGGHLTLKLTARVMTEDGVKYTCHCDWESAVNNLKTQWDVQYPYLVWLEWYQTLRAKYPSHINNMAPFSGTAFMTTKAVVEERLTKINEFFQDLVLDRFMMETPEVVCWFRCQESIRIAKREYFEKFRLEREKKLREAEEAERKKQMEVKAAMPNEEDMEDPLSYLCAL